MQDSNVELVVGANPQLVFDEGESSDKLVLLHIYYDESAGVYRVFVITRRSEVISLANKKSKLIM